MKRLLLVFTLLCVGCTVANIPAYLSNEKPYTKRYYANFETVHAATQEALQQLGWEVEGTSDPGVYEQQRSVELDEQQILIFTTVRQTPMFLGTRYAKMNIFIRSKNNTSEVEIRYLTVTSVLFRTVKSYQNQGPVKRVFERITEIIEGPPAP